SGDSSMIGHEKETLESRPTSPKDHPDIPEGKALMGHEEEDIAPEKQTKDKGTVIAGSDAKSEAHKQAEIDRRKEAIRVAGRMLEVGDITAADLSNKIEELARYESAQIRDLEKAIFA